MVKAQEYWKQFEQTGDIRDYLNYTACTSERDQVLQEAKNQEEVTQKREKETEHDRFYQCNRDCFSDHADWGL